MSEVLSQLRDLLGDRQLLEGDALKDHPACVFTVPLAIMRPDSTAAVSAAVKICHDANQPIVPLGGRTGLVGGGLAGPDEIVLSLELMNEIEELDQRGRTMVVQAGAPLQAVQEAAEKAELMFPLDMGSRGSATIGGNIATNAGGNRVVRYGMTREMVLGVEAVLADGTVISSMNKVIKNNTGYDLKQLFIGSEGTLGIVTRAVLRLRPRSRSCNSALLAVEDFDKVIALLAQTDAVLGGSMSSFEVMWPEFYQHVTEGGKRHQLPLPDNYPYYVIVEAMGANQEADDERFNGAMEELFESGLVVDGIVCQSISERESIWEIRDDIEALYSLYPFFTFDISLPLAEMESYIATVREQVAQHWSGSRCIIFGHLGDGNIHLIVTADSDSPETRHAVEEIVYGALRGRDGVISAEHGIGLEKKSHLDVSRSPAEIALMQTLKQALDPRGILNPGKVIDTVAV
jgi:FAD/FMN-containing dehydrogenase